MKKTKIEIKLRRKTDKELVATIIKSKKNSSWLKVADKISMPKRKQISLNLDQIDKRAQEHDVVVIPGKVLGLGNINKKIKVVALSFSGSAEEKLKKSKTEFSTIAKELKENPEAKKVKILNL